MVKKAKYPKKEGERKRPLNAYMIFVQQFRKDHDHEINNDPNWKKVTAVAQKAAAEWNRMGESGQAKYKRQADALKAKWEKSGGVSSPRKSPAKKSSAKKSPSKRSPAKGRKRTKRSQKNEGMDTSSSSSSGEEEGSEDGRMEEDSYEL
jgi:hypothetical protein